MIFGFQVVAIAAVIGVLATIVWQRPAEWKFAVFMIGCCFALMVKDSLVWGWFRSYWRTRNQAAIAQLFPLTEGRIGPIAASTTIEYFRARNDRGELVPAMRRGECDRPEGCTCRPENFNRCPYYVVVIEQIDTIEPVERATPPAEKRARALLRALLTREQLESYDRTGLFTVPLGNGDCCILGDGFIRWPNGHKQCVHPHDGYAVGGDLPFTDSVITQLLWLRNNPTGIAAVGHLRPDGTSNLASLSRRR